MGAARATRSKRHWRREGRSNSHPLGAEIRLLMYFREATSDPNLDEIGLDILSLLAQKPYMEDVSDSL